MATSGPQPCSCNCGLRCTCGAGPGGGPRDPQGGGPTGGRQGGDGPPGWKPQPQGTWLLIRYDAADVGARPVPNGEVFWESPDIHVSGGDAFGNPTGGQPVIIEARVWNQGSIDAAPVRVDFYFIAPALGITTSAPQSIGTAWTTLLAGHSRIVACPQPWTPPKYPTNLHACIIVTCSAPAQHDTPTAPSNPVLDRHVGQRNLTVLEAGAGERIPLHLTVGNVLPRQAQLGIVAAAVWVKGREAPMSAPLRATLGPLGVARALAATGSASEARLWARRQALLDVQARGAARQDMAKAADIAQVQSLRVKKGGAAAGGVVPPAALVPHLDFVSIHDDVALAPEQTGTAQIEIAIPAKPRAPWLSVHIAQTQDGALTGGYTMLIKTTK